MSLDCYPFGDQRSIGLNEQPMAIDVAYDDDLLICVTDNCNTISVYDLSTSINGDHLIKKLTLGENIVIDQVIYCRTGDYIACVGHNNGQLSLYTIFDWRPQENGDKQPVIEELDVASFNSIEQDDVTMRRDKLNSISSCQMSGNMAASYGDLVQVYKLSDLPGDSKVGEDEIITDDIIIDVEPTGVQAKSRFTHIISVKLSMWAMSIKLVENYLSITAVDHVQVLKLDLLTIQIPSDLTTDCITWNLNTKRLVKLPTLMHNTSTNLSSYHICHPLELLGPASESMACRVECHIFSKGYFQNQLEAFVMLCKQFDFDKDPVKVTHLQPIYLSSLEDQKRLSKSISSTLSAATTNNSDHSIYETNQNLLMEQQTRDRQLLKSSSHHLLASVTCYVATLKNCSLYSLHGRKVCKLQTITHPDLCLDLRPDLLNVHLLTPLGLQICSTASCDSTFRYDWSSASDLNLNFVACNRTKVLTSRNFIILTSASTSVNESSMQATPVVVSEELKGFAILTNNFKSTSSMSAASACLVEFMTKPKLADLFSRIVHTVQRCDSISIRSNLLSYLHASAQLELIGKSRQLDGSDNDQDREQYQQQRLDTIRVLRLATVKLCQQLSNKKQTNVITNSRIDKVIKHLLDISFCDLAELMRRHLSPGAVDQPLDELSGGSTKTDHHQAAQDIVSFNDDEESTLGFDNYLINSRKMKSLTSEHRVDVNKDDDDDDRVDGDEQSGANYELIEIYLRHAKYSQTILNYLRDNAGDESVMCKVVTYMYEFNPRLLVKCAQRLAGVIDQEDQRDRYKLLLTLMREKLKQLSELDSTGINRATVLFTLAIIHNSLDEREDCLHALNLIKPQNHLAITMCSNYKASHSIARLVNENYPVLFTIFLNQLSKRDWTAASEFIRLYRPGEQLQSMSVNHSNLSTIDETNGRQQNSLELTPGSSCQLSSANTSKEGHKVHDDDDDEEDLDDLFDQNTQLSVELLPIDLDELIKQTDIEQERNEQIRAQVEQTRAYIKSSINLLESKFLLSRLSENN